MIQIRRATGTDAQALLEYCRHIGGESDNLTYGPEGLPFTVEQERAFLESHLDSQRDVYLVAVKDGQIVGTGTFNSLPQERLSHRGEISVSVRKHLWGGHIGTLLMERLLTFARDCAKVEIVSLEVRSDNARAIALYKKFGFETVGTFRGFLKIRGEHVSCDIMRLELGTIKNCEKS